MPTIQLRDPIVDTEIFYPRTDDLFSDEIGARVVVGGVVVMERIYNRDYTKVGLPSHAENEEDAMEKVAAEFGEAIKRLLNPG